MVIHPHILVSGGSRGLGLEIVKFCVLKRHCVVSTFARSITKELQGFMDSRPFGTLHVVFYQADARDPRQIEAVVQAAYAEFGPFYGLVNNAAIGQDALLSHLSIEKLQEILAVNLAGAIWLTRLAVRKMLLDGGGKIINISSICASKGYVGLAAYAASKGGLEAFTRSLAVELGSRGILVNAIALGFFQSEMSSVLTPDQARAIERRTPTGRLCTPQDILSVLDMLLFGESNITGQVFHIDGGAGV